MANCLKVIRCYVLEALYIKGECERTPMNWDRSYLAIQVLFSIFPTKLIAAMYLSSMGKNVFDKFYRVIFFQYLYALTQYLRFLITIVYVYPYAVGTF